MKGEDRFFIDGVTCSLDGYPMRVANLSVGGLFAASDRVPMAGQIVELEIVLGARPPFRVVGKVTWINDPRQPKSPDLPQGFGVKIQKIAFADKLAILDVLKRSPQAVIGRRQRR